MDKLAPHLADAVVCQIGRGSYKPRYCKYFGLKPSLVDYLVQARLVVGHGGLGTIMSAVRLGKPFIGVSNPDRPDHHQEEILGQFEAANYILWCRSIDKLADCIASALERQFALYVEPSCEIARVVARFLSANDSKRSAAFFQEVRS
jgi:UDP-N-acetylglucosamine transferase subunit ALG13